MKKLLAITILSSLLVGQLYSVDSGRAAKVARKTAKVKNGHGRKAAKNSPVKRDNARKEERKKKIERKAKEDALIAGSIGAFGYNASAASPKKPAGLMGSPLRAAVAAKFQELSLKGTRLDFGE